MASAKRIEELMAQRRKLLADVRAVAEKASAEKRSSSPEELAEIDRMEAEGDRLADLQKTEQRALDLERRSKELEDEERSLSQSAGRKVAPGPGGAPAADQQAVDLRRKAVRSFLVGGRSEMSDEERRSLEAYNNATGGALVAPLEMSQELWKQVDDLMWMRQKATKRTVSLAQSLGVPTMESRADDADWTAEIGTTTADASQRFGRRQLTPHKLSKMSKYSNAFLRLAPNAENIVMAEIAYKNALTQEKAFLVGDGVEKPLGVFTASADGISTGRDVSTGSTTAITTDSVLDALYSLKAQYVSGSEWIMHRDVAKAVAKLKDGEGHYFFQSSLVEGQPDRLKGRPLNLSEHAPSTFTADMYLAVLGDFSNYMIADALQLELQRLVELYSLTDQVAIIGRSWSDGQPIREEAFARIKTAAA